MSSEAPTTIQEINDNFDHGARFKALLPENYTDYGNKKRLRTKWGFASPQSFAYNLEQKHNRTETVTRICNAEGMTLADFYAPTNISKIEIVSSGGNIEGNDNSMTNQTGIGNTGGDPCKSRIKDLNRQIKLLQDLIKQKDNLLEDYRSILKNR